MTYKVIIIAFLWPVIASAQTETDSVKNLYKPSIPDSIEQKDIGDYISLIFKSKKKQQKKQEKKISITILPSIGYTLTTGFATDLAGNAVFYTSKSHRENRSVITGDLSYDVKLQKLFVSRSELWFNNNDIKFTSDIRWEKFPENTYGFGTGTSSYKADPLLFNFVKTYLNIYKRVTSTTPLYLGLGYNLDYHYNVKETSPPDYQTDFQLYGAKSRTTSSGLNADILYDSRNNTINSQSGLYANLTLTQNLKALGSNDDWKSLFLDVRKYIPLSTSNNNVLALWGIAWFTRGRTPYLDLPFTGGDMYNNSGRGYIQGRFTGRNMLYLESEYRFGILKNGLLGGVVFVNAETLSEYPSNRFQYIAPGYGTGIRVKLNKVSNTNVAIDYGFGLYGSRGFFVSLGEVF